ncbi:hypothetical protein DFT13_17120, partial [Salmonella enterica]|nr:hypothetical protein [Salmonella enterica]
LYFRPARPDECPEPITGTCVSSPAELKRFSHYEKKSANLSYQKNQIALKRFKKSGSFCFSTQEKLPVL